MMLSSLRLLEPLGLDFHSDELNNFSVRFDLEEARWLDRQLAILRGYDRDRMSESQKLSTDVLEWYLSDSQRGNRFLFHDYPVNQLGGLQSSMPDFMINIHQVKKLRDAENSIRRISKFGIAFDQVLEGLKLREERGIVPPRFVLEKTVKQMRDFVGVPSEQNVLFTDFQKKLASVPKLDASKREDLLSRFRAQIQNTVYPAYGRLMAYCDALERKATADDGVWKLPEGDAYYRHRLRHYTTAEMGPDEIHGLGLRETARIQGQIKEILSREGYSSDDLAGVMNRLNEEERFLYPDSEEGRRQILADYQAIISEIDGKLAPLFNLRPKSRVKVERVPEFREASAPGAHYQPPSLDGSRPGVFFANLRSVREVPKFSMRTLAYHEAIPGHHFQIGIAQELRGLPFFRRLIPFTAYTEGWALYAERLAVENGFQNDPYDRLGALTAELFRAVRLVVDTGIHRKRWTREQAIDYMLKNTGMPETDVVAEIERYIVLPGQACAYKVGQLKILALREKARERLGPRFDIKRFHDVVLRNGALPLSLLERVVERWIEAEGKAA